MRTMSSLLETTATRHVQKAEIVIGDIESRVLALKANWPDGAEMRELALLFAILKVGESTQKLQWFTHYDPKFIINQVHQLRCHGKLFTGLSSQFVLSQLPGSEALIAEITGARPFVEAPKPKLTLAPTPQFQPEVKPMPEEKSTLKPDAENCWCGREARHKGWHRGQSPKTNKVAVKSAPAIADKRAPERPKSIAPANGRAEKSVAMGGGTITLIADGVNFLELADRDRQLVYTLTDLMSKHNE